MAYQSDARFEDKPLPYAAQVLPPVDAALAPNTQI